MRRWWTSVVVRKAAMAIACLWFSTSAIAQDKVRVLYFSSFPEIMQKEGEPGLSHLAELLDQERAKTPTRFLFMEVPPWALQYLAPWITART